MKRVHMKRSIMFLFLNIFTILFIYNFYFFTLPMNQLSELKQPLSLKEYCIGIIMNRFDDLGEKLAILPTELKDEIYTFHKNLEQKLYPLITNSEKINIVKMMQPLPSKIKSFLKLDENKIALGLKDNAIHIMQLIPFQELMVLDGHTGPITALAKIDNNTIASGSADTTINIWDLEKKQVIQQLTGLTQEVEKLKKINNRTIASIARTAPEIGMGYDCQAITLWDIESGEKIKTIPPRRNQQIIKLNDHTIAYFKGRAVETYDFKNEIFDTILESLAPTNVPAYTTLTHLNKHTIAASPWASSITIYDLKTKAIKEINTQNTCDIDIIKKIDTDLDATIICDNYKPRFKVCNLLTSEIFLKLDGQIANSVKFKKFGNLFLSYETTKAIRGWIHGEKNAVYLWDLRPLLIKKYTPRMVYAAYKLLCEEKKTKEECIKAIAQMFDELDKQSALKSSTPGINESI